MKKTYDLKNTNAIDYSLDEWRRLCCWLWSRNQYCKVRRNNLLSDSWHHHEQQNADNSAGLIQELIMVSCMPKSFLKAVQLSMKDLPSTTAKLCGFTRKDMKTQGEIVVNTTSHPQAHNVRMIITDLGSELNLGLDSCHLFKVVKVADTCGLHNINARVEAVHITEESELGYTKLLHKWEQHLPLSKKTATNTTQLAHSNPELPVVIETDACLKGLGAVLIQNGSPIRFLSKSLIPAESAYSNKECELLAILLACEKLYVHISGRTMTIHMHHKPLENIFWKPISLVPPRLLPMLKNLQPASQVCGCLKCTSSWHYVQTHHTWKRPSHPQAKCQHCLSH